MDTMLRFVNMLAWAICVLFGLRALLALFFDYQYRYTKAGRLLYLRDQLQGVTRSYPWPRYFCYSGVAALWIIAASAY